MPTDPDAPLPPPPRPAHLKRGVRNIRRAYRSLVALIVLVLGGWSAIDFYHWAELSGHARVLALGFGLAALIALLVWRQVEKPLGRELRLSRRGMMATGTLLAIGKPRGRRQVVTISYSFQTPAGAAMQSDCRLPRRFPIHRLTLGMPLELLYDPRNPRINKPRLAFSYVDFGEQAKKQTAV